MLCLASYAKRNNDTLYLDFEPCCDDDGELLRDRMDVVVRLADGFTLGLVTRTGSLARTILRITDGKLDRYTFSASDAVELGFTVTPDGFLATAAEREEMGIDLK